MNTAVKNTSLNESTLIWAVICSILLHILFFVVVPNFKFDAIKKIPDQLTVEIIQPKPPEPVVLPEPPKPIEQPKPESIAKEIKPLPKKEFKPEPNPVEAAPQPTHAEPPPPPAVIAVAPTAEAPAPVVTVPPPPPEPPKKIEPSEDDINAARGQYRGTLGRSIAKHKQYPKIAQMRGWQGDCVLDLKIDSAGNVLSVDVKESSGFEVLDKQAIEMARKAAPFPAPPEALRGRNFNITVPITFKLE